MPEFCEFSDLVREAFIDPLRSVLIVDDQYPTWEETFNEHRPKAERDRGLYMRSIAKKWRQNPDAPAKVIGQFRARKPGLIIDVHYAYTAISTVQGGAGVVDDASESEIVVADHLHQSDLLILDYNLEGASTGLEGTLARSILASVLKNQHFNLVVVHTEEPDLEAVFANCILSLHAPFGSQISESKRALLDTLNTRLEELADEETFRITDFSQYFDAQTYLTLRHPETDFPGVIREFMRGNGPLTQLGNWATELGLTNGMRSAFACWAIEHFEKSRSSLFSDTPFDGLKWSISGDRMWLRTGRGFVTFINKAQSDLMAELQNSLVAWQPTPSRLLSAKLRHEISCNGVEAEDRTLSRKHVFAHFYHQLRSSTTHADRAKLLQAQLNRQMESLASQIEGGILAFGEAIHVSDEHSGGAFKSHYGIDLDLPDELKTAITHFNSYVSTLPANADTGHLDCGHIFKIDEEWWVCATPACDMQPGQNSIAFVGTSKNLRPFTALRLYQRDGALEAYDINSGLFCFVESKPGEIICLGLPQPDGAVNSEKATWRTLIATNDGNFYNNELSLVIPKLTDDKIETNDKNARIVSKLRYEYALNYVQKVGASVTRIGLDYTS